MTDWLRLPSGQALNMDSFVALRRRGEADIDLLTARGETLALTGPDAHAVGAYLERVHVGARTADEKPPRGPDRVIRKT